ncbi:MAG: hypothetical protein M9931_05350 [Chitinophagales bacterium]|nr:hypothetical protein [Chitinophagales bacterium]
MEDIFITEVKLTNILSGRDQSTRIISIPSYVTWFDYMSPAGGTNAPNGTAAPQDAASGEDHKMLFPIPKITLQRDQSILE